MRILLLSALLGLTASCAAPPPAAVAPGSPPTATAIAAILGPAPPPVAAAPPPVALVPVRPVQPVPLAAPAAPGPVAAVAPVAAAPVAVMVDWQPLPRIWFEMFQGLNAPGPAGRLTLSNFNFDTARVQVTLANGPECAAPDPAATADFVMPLNATRIIAPPPGADICWRREAPAQAEPGASPAMAGWAGWNRAYTASGRFIDSRL